MSDFTLTIETAGYLLGAVPLVIAIINRILN